MNASLESAVQPRVTTSWLALPLSARGLIDELAKYAHDNDVVSLCIDEAADARAIGTEIARLLCAHQGELARVRGDAKVLLECGFIALDAGGLWISTDITPTERVAETPSPKPSTIRMRLLRDRERASRRDASTPSHVTPTTVTSDVRGDAGDASHVTRALSQDLKFNKLRSLRERAGDGAGLQRCIAPDLPFSDEARAIAERVGVREPVLTFQGFKAYYLERRTLSQDWMKVWERWVVREVKFERALPPAKNQPADLDADWLRAASEST